MDAQTTYSPNDNLNEHSSDQFTVNGTVGESTS